MRLRVPGAVGVVCAVTVAAMLGAASARADAAPPFGQLADAITGSSLHADQQTGLLQRVALADTLVTPGLAFPPSPCAATGLVDSIGFTTQGLFAAGQINSGDVTSLISAVDKVNYAIVFSSGYPPSPCTVAFLSGYEGS